MTLRALAAPILLLAALASASHAAVPPTLAASELRPGQKAIVHTVFAGDSIETFDAEIVGVLAGGRAEGDMILARATSERVIRSGVAEGMSGSPVYVDGKLIGALSSGWTFSKEPIFGITPIAEMLAVLNAPETAHPEGTAGPLGVDPVPTREAFHGLTWPGADDSLPAAMPAPGATSLPHTLALPLAAGGLDPRALALLQPWFTASGFTLTAGGRAAPAAKGVDAGATLEAGSPIAVDVLRGDLNLSAIGTVTWRDGDKLLLFGHPFFQSGEVRLPLSTAHIIGILPSLANSFKLGVPGTPIGVATQDRRAAVAGHIGPPPALLPFGVRVDNAGRAPQEFHFESVEDRSLLPQLVATATLNSVLESGGNATQQSVRWWLDAWAGPHALHVHDVDAGDSPLGDMVGSVVGPLRFLYNNPFERVRLDSVRVRVVLVAGRQQETLRSASLGAAIVRPGARLRVVTESETWRGARTSRTLEIDVPHDLPNGRYALWLGGGSEADRFMSSRLPGRYRPTSLADAWRRLQAVRTSDALYAMLWARAPEVTTGGEDYPELPGSALALMAAPQSGGDLARRGDWALVVERQLAVDGALRGELVLDVTVDSKAP